MVTEWRDLFFFISLSFEGGGGLGGDALPGKAGVQSTKSTLFGCINKTICIKVKKRYNSYLSGFSTRVMFQWVCV